MSDLCSRAVFPALSMQPVAHFHPCGSAAGVLLAHSTAGCLPVVFYNRTVLFLCMSQCHPPGWECLRRGTGHYLPPKAQGFHTNWKNFRNILMYLGLLRTNKRQPESANRGENNILSLLAQRVELDNILLFFLSIFHHSSSIIEERETKGQGNG